MEASTRMLITIWKRVSKDRTPKSLFQEAIFGKNDSIMDPADGQVGHEGWKGRQKTDDFSCTFPRIDGHG